MYFSYNFRVVHVCLCLTPQLQRCRDSLHLSLPPPLDSVVAWLQRAEAALTDEREVSKSHAEAAKDARTKQDNLEVCPLLVLVLRYLILKPDPVRLIFVIDDWGDLIGNLILQPFIFQYL